MLNNKNIGTKIGIGIISIILIISLSMGFVYYKLKDVQKDSEIIVNEYLPEVTLSKDILENSNNIMYNMRGYGLNGNEEYYNLAIEDFDKLENNISQGEELIGNSQNLKKLQMHLDELKANREKYYTLAQNTKVENDNIEAVRNELDKKALILVEDVNGYLENQETKFQNNINNNLSSNILSERLLKITVMNKALDYINGARIINYKAMVEKDSVLAKEAVEELNTSLDEIEKLVPLTTQQVDIDSLDTVKNEIIQYKSGIMSLAESYERLENLAGEREEAGNNLILAAEETATAGINNTKQMNETNQNDISAVIGFLVSGLIFAIIIGSAINFYITKKIVKGLKNMNNVANKLAKGEVDVSINIDSNDEVGILAKAFNKLIENIKEQVNAVEKIADGDLNVEIRANSEKDILNIKLMELKQKFKEVIKLTEENSDLIMEGALDIRLDENKYENDWKHLVENINSISDSLEGYIKSVPTTIATLDKEYNIKYLNDYGLNLANKTLKEAKEHKCFELFDSGDCNTENCVCKNAMTKDIVIESSSKANINGKTYDIEYSGTPIKNRNGDIVGAFEILNDQTEIMNNQRLMEKRNKYQSKEVVKLVENLNELSNGNLELKPEVEKYDEDTKYVAENFIEINEKLSESTRVIRGYIAEISDILSGISNGNLDQSVDKDYRGDFSEIKESLNGILNSMNEVMAEISIAADEVATGSTEVARSAEDLSQGSTEQASAIEQINSSITNIADQTRKNAANSEEVNKKSNRVILSAEEGTEKMNDMIEAMDLINKSSKNIGKIIKVIDEIAFQTNILALNAAVEAERAGKYGKGFAVVAEEVRNLAGRSANAAKDTTELIEDSIEKISLGTKTAEKTGVALNDIVGGIKEVSTIIEDIAKASNEQAVAIEEINEGLQQVTDVTQSNTATAEESSAASEEMSSQAEILNEKVSQFVLRNNNRYTNNHESSDQDYEEAEIMLEDGFGKY